MILQLGQWFEISTYKMQYPRCEAQLIGKLEDPAAFKDKWNYMFLVPTGAGCKWSPVGYRNSYYCISEIRYFNQHYTIKNMSKFKLLQFDYIFRDEESIIRRIV